jgi:hypothetical protein
MAKMTYYVALAFKKAEDDGGEIVACDPREASNSEQAIRMAAVLAAEEGHCGAIAFSRTGDPALGDFEDALIFEDGGRGRFRAIVNLALSLTVAFGSSIVS